ncbi:MAG: hypothetical protein JXR70_07590 [Spirochaetales bacterium]|nr:hypothetical protein [Spirochaetales bacterium]
MSKTKAPFFRAKTSDKTKGPENILCCERELYYACITLLRTKAESVMLNQKLLKNLVYPDFIFLVFLL